MNIADRIQYLRKQKGYSQEELADKVGVSRQAVSKWESEQSTPDLEKVIAMSELFEVTTDYILKGIEPVSTTNRKTVKTLYLGFVLIFATIAGIWSFAANRFNSKEILVTAGRTDDKISELETQLDIAFREEVKIFIRKYGVLIGYGVEIVACGLNGHSRFVEDTLRFRKNGLEKKYIVIEGDSELAYCLNNETGEIVNWGLDNFEVYPVAESLESFLLAQFEEGKRNWQ